MLHVRKNDTVKVISGNSRNKTGKVIKVFPVEGRALVQGVNMVWKHMRRSVDYPHGARIQKEAPIKLSNLMVVCQSCNKSTRAFIEKAAQGKTRLCKKCKQPVSIEE
ncbi:MAG: 50S ribosomal protein L24 [Planctomycetes bacterium]|nr:50S ribosomal protein L24 [Planctomycetota bacterium]